MVDPDSESRLRQLEDAIEAYLARDATVPADTFLNANAPLRELLAPMLQPPAADEPSAPPQLGDLDLVREIGRGGMGVVYEADDRRLKRRVAVKVMRRTAATPASAIVRFWREAELAAALRHPGVVPVHSLGETADAFYLVMELERAASLADVLAELGDRDAAALGSSAIVDAARRVVAERFPDALTTAVPAPATRSHAHAAVEIVQQVAAALGHAHAQGVIHRDVKPGNILLDPSGRAYLTDFGLACVQDTPGVTQTGDAPGTPHYMAPEQIRGGRRGLGPATDVFALGATLYELLTLRRAFRGGNAAAVLFDVVHRDPVDPAALHAALPRDLVAIVHRALEKDPARRYPTAREFVADLDRFLRGDPVSARPITRRQRLRRWAAREPWRALAAGLLLAGLPVVAVLAAAALRSDPKAAAGERVLRLAWIDAQLAHGFREAGEGDREAARGYFEDILREVPASEEGVAGLSAIARSRDDGAALAVLADHADALAHSAALRRRQASLLRRSGRADEAKVPAAGLDAQALGFDAFLDGYDHLELGHRGSKDEYATAARLLHRAVVTSDRARPLFYYEWLHAAAHARDRDGVDAATAAIRQLWPDEAAGWYWIAFAQDELGEREAAITSLAHALQLDPGFFSAAINHARLVRTAGRPGDGIAALRAALPHAPRSVLLHRELAIALHAVRDFTASAAMFQTALLLTPGDLVLRRDLASVLLEAGDANAGGAIAAALVAERPDDHDARYLLALAASKLGDHKAAKTNLEQCIAGRPTAPACFQLGLACAALDDPAGARAAYEHALALDARHVPAAVNLALVFVRAGDNERAEALLRSALAVQPAFLQARRVMLRVLEQRPAEAVTLCREWLQHAPALAEAWRYLAWSLLQTGAAEVRAEALAAARKADAMTGGADGPTLHVLGAAVLASGDAEAALAIVQRALAALDPADKFTPFYTAQMQATLQQCEAARKPGGQDR